MSLLKIMISLPLKPILKGLSQHHTHDPLCDPKILENKMYVLLTKFEKSCPYFSMAQSTFL